MIGFIVGFVLFYEVGFVLMLSLVFIIVVFVNILLLYVGVLMVVVLFVIYGFLLLYLGLIVIVIIFNVDMGKILLYGIILVISIVIFVGLVYVRVLKGIDKLILEGLYSVKIFSEEEMSSFGVSVWIFLVSVVLMAMCVIVEMILSKGYVFLSVVEFFGDLVMVMLIVVLIVMFIFGLNCGRLMD